MSDHKRMLRDVGNGPTKRNLFGPVDREQLQVEYNDALQKDLEEASRRWNYDFVSDKPLEGGDFQWEGVSAVRVPVLYNTCQTEEQLTQRGTEESQKENIPRTPERFTSVPKQHTEGTPEKNEAQKRKQTNITDFYQAKKRLVTPRKSGQ
ncbi:cyclin-dependent kinase inhibitor 1 [Triplophysa dalaica]|uniref:cyclin-dependent kinase inhibitor 1 n=1 Tax=Triplophysa dalaica TaxID=1582913 RepID=UPI0024DFC812|nr:cyclin-dependent kinase inhibitor 1 [Triplophysa dalaica]